MCIRDRTNKKTNKKTNKNTEEKKFPWAMYTLIGVGALLLLGAMAMLIRGTRGRDRALSETSQHIMDYIEYEDAMSDARKALREVKRKYPSSTEY